MQRCAALSAVAFAAGLAACFDCAIAQLAESEQTLDTKQLLGMRLFNQSCRICHTKPQMTSPLYGPELSQSSAGGNEQVIRDTIGNGTPRMPGFKYHFDSGQIEAIVAYLKTIPTPTPGATR
jgi:mono/diheme cytochrome c family protein